MEKQISSLEPSHFPVMLDEVIKISSPSAKGKYIDCTFGGGGYSKEILKFPETHVEAFDRDEKALKISKKFEKKFPHRFKFHHNRFSKLDKVLKGSADAIIFDLGLSSIQLDDHDRGFSFKSKKKLDMSMGLNEFTASDVINNLSETNLRSIIKILGDEKEASIIAKNIVKFRKLKKIIYTNDLVKIIEKSKKKIYKKKINPSTKTFQALRIFVNKEITELIYGIIKATKFLKPGGKILVISFHSIEDKIVKYFFNFFSNNKSRSSRYIPDNEDMNIRLFDNYKNRVFRPTKNELDKNNRSRSAKLRFATRSKSEFEYPYELIKKFKKYLDLEDIDV